MTIREINIPGENDLQISSYCFTCQENKQSLPIPLDLGESGLNDTRRISKEHDMEDHNGKGKIVIVTTQTPMGYGTLYNIAKSETA